MPLESTLTTVLPKKFPWGNVTQAGSLVPLVDPSQPFDWVLYAQRDRQLAYRDVTLVSDVIVVTVEASMIWGIDASPIRPVLSTGVATNPLSNTADDLPSVISSSGTVQHITNLSSPFDAARVDKELFARDLVIYESLARSSDFLSTTPYSGTLFSQELPSPPFARLTNGGTIIPEISSAWSLAQGTLTNETLNPVLPLDVSLFKRPDQNLTARDNIIAAYTANVEHVLRDPFAYATRVHLETNLMGVGERESETYVLADEAFDRRIFQAEPFLPGRLRLVYNKLTKTVQWLAEDPLTVHIPQGQPFIIGSVTVNGVDAGQQLTFVPATLGRKDAAFWRQKAKRVNFTPKVLQHIALFSRPSDAFVSGLGVLSMTDVAMPRPGTVRFLLPSTLEPSSYRVAVLFAPLPKLTLPGSQTLDVSTATADKGINFPMTGGTSRWGFTLPPGQWTANIQFTNIAGTAPGEFRTTLGITGMTTRQVGLRFALDRHANGDLVTTQVPMTATGTPQILSVAWAPNAGNTTQLHVVKVEFVSTLTTVIDLDLEAKLITASGQIGATATAVLSGKRYRPDMVAFQFLVGETTVVDPFFDLTLLSEDDTLLTIKQIQVQRIVDLDITPNATGFEPLKGEFLDRALESVMDSYATYLAQFPETDFRQTLSDGSTTWTALSTENWIEAIKTVEPRVDQAFRPSRCGDIGRMALVPEGLELVLAPAPQGLIEPGTVKANYAAVLGLPRLRPFQAWMVDIGLYVAHEDFWDAEDIGYVPPAIAQPDPSSEIALFNIGLGTSDLVRITPTTFSGLAGWWKADSYNGGGGTTIVDGTAIGTSAFPGVHDPLIDLSGGGRDFGAQNGAVHPYYTMNIVGAMPVIRWKWDEGPTALFCPELILPGNFTVIIAASTSLHSDTRWVGEALASTNFRRNRCYYGNPGAYGGNYNNFRNRMAFYDGGSGVDGSGSANEALSGGGVQWAGGPEGPGTDPSEVLLNYASNLFGVMVWRRQGTTIDFRENKTTFIGRSGMTVGTTRITTLADSYSGGNIAPRQTDFGELIIYSSYRTDAELNKLYDSYLKPRWVTLP